MLHSPTPDPVTFVVSVDVPYPTNAADRALWDGASPDVYGVAGFTPVALRAAVTGVGSKTLTWMPDGEAGTWLRDRLFQRLAGQKIGDTRLLARMTLHGNFIWSEKGIYLDGDSFGVPPGNDVQFRSGDDRPGGDFRMWFWLRRLIKSVSVTPGAASVGPGQRLAFVSVELFDPAPTGGLNMEFAPRSQAGAIMFKSDTVMTAGQDKATVPINNESGNAITRGTATYPKDPRVTVGDDATEVSFP